MAPKRGLKASKGAVATVPPPPPPAPSAGDERTYPTDGDSLTISDLFELRTSILALILLPSPTQEQQDEATNLLRGILHGADALIALSATSFSLSDSDDFFSPSTTLSLPPSTTEEDSETQLRLSSLGLLAPSAPLHIAYLQAFALHELSSTLSLSPSLPSALLSSSNPSKRRKIDVREPQKPEEWLDRALERYEVAMGLLGKEKSLEVKALVEADRARARCDRAVLGFLEGGKKKKKSKGAKPEDWAELVKGIEFGKILEQLEKAETKEEDVEDIGDVASAVLRSAAIYFAVLDGGFDDVWTQEEKLAILKTLLEGLGKKCLRVAEEGSGGEEYEPTSVEGKKRKLEIEMLRADVALALFVALEDEVEEKYRPAPDEDSDEDEEKEDDEDEEVTPLPDEEDVREAKKAGEDAATLIKSTITLLEAGPTSSDAKAGIKAQYQKLEEAYLTLSALVNPDDEEGTKSIEVLLEKVRSDGGLDS